MGPGERKNLIQPPDWWRAFEAEAEKRGVSLAEWMGNACRRALPADVRAELSDRRGPGRAKSPVADTTSGKSKKSV